MKNPIVAICPAIGRLPPSRARWMLTASGGLCAAVVLAFVRSDGSITRSPVSARQSGAEISRVGETINERVIDHAPLTADPARALVHAFTLGDRSERDSLVRDLLSGWAARDAEAALNWVSSLEDPSVRRSARSTVCLVVAEKDPRRAVVLALDHGADEGDGAGLLECLTMRWCERECETVIDWAREQPPGEWRERLLSSASFVLSKSDPAAAAQLVSGLAPGNVQNEAAMAVLHQWALQDSTAALQWAEAFSEPTLRERALEEISNLRKLTTSLQEVR